MAMTRKQRRTTMIVSALVVLGAAVGLVLYALEDTIVFFYTPSEVAEKKRSGRPTVPARRPGCRGLR